MSAYETRQDVADKIDWEGGLPDAVEYGLKVEDMPEGDDELREAWRELEVAFLAFDQAADKVRDLLPDLY